MPYWAEGDAEGAERALASFPLMAEEIADRLGIRQLRAITDAEGRFRYEATPPGLYGLVFRREGYVGPAKPGDRPTSPIVTATVKVLDGIPPAPVVVELIARN